MFLILITSTVIMSELIKLLVIGLVVYLRYSYAYEDCEAFYANSDDGKNPGKCVPFPECPYLFDVIKSPSRTLAEIRLLQNLTCVRDPDNPYICCAVDDLVKQIESNNPSDYNAKPNRPGQTAVDTKDNIVFSQDSNDVRNRRNLTKPAPHKNFNLLPTLKECSRNVDITDRIVGGNETSILEWPWMARIGFYSYDEDDVKYLCAGTVINKRYILTAGHCMEEINPEDFELAHVRVGEKDRECDVIYGCSRTKDIKIEKAIPHPNYSTRDKSNDIALIRLAEDIDFSENRFTQPVCLPFAEEYGVEEHLDPSLRKHLDNGKPKGWVAGWGKTSWVGSEGSEYLQAVALPLISTNQCRKNYENHKKVVINDFHICGGGEAGKDSCGGDSGGGIFVPERVPIVGKIKMPKWFQFGVVSFGPVHCGVGGLPGVYSSTYKYKNWILDQLEP